jgi:hypothetical protein
MYNLNDAVLHIYSKRKGLIVANSTGSEHVVVEFLDGSSEVIHSAELQNSDHLSNPSPQNVSDRLNVLLEDTSVREVASKEFSLGQDESLMNIAFLPLSHEMEITTVTGTKITAKKISVKFAKQALNKIENRVS